MKLNLNTKFDPTYVPKEEKTCELHGKYSYTQTNRICYRFVPYGECPECFLKRERDHLMKSSGIPRRYVTASFEAYKPINESQLIAHSAAQKYAFDVMAGWDGSLLLLGPCGTGKTHLACSILHQCAEGLLGGRYTTAREIILEVRSSWRSNSERGEAVIIGDFANVPVLLIDELGTQSGTENELQILFDILDARYAKMSPTIVCSNLNGEALKALLGQRIMDRLRDNGRVVPVTGDSHRKLAA